VATKRLRGAPDLKGSTVAVLLAGWGAVAPDPGPHGFGGGFVVLCEPGGAERLWAAHEAWIREVAQAWGWTPTIVGPDGQRRFWAEHLACGFDEPDGDDDDEDDE
jgi:hypothetical protein